MPPVADKGKGDTVSAVVSPCRSRYVATYLPSRTAILPAFFILLRALLMLCSPDLLPLRPRPSRMPPRVMPPALPWRSCSCLLYTSDAADDLLCVDLGGR